MTAPSPGERIAAALRRSPLHVDPSLASALPADRRRRILDELARQPQPTYIILVPIIAGGTWQDPEQLAAVVQSRLGRGGVFVTLGEYTDTLHSRLLPGDPGDERGTAVRRSALAVSLDPDFRDASLADRLDRVLELLRTGEGDAEYRRQSAALRERTRSRSAEARPEAGEGAADDGGALLPALGGAGVAAAAVGGFLLWRHRRIAAVARARGTAGEALLLPRAVFATADRATRDELHAQASAEVIAFGELLDGTDVPGTDPAVRDLLARALDAYSAAGKVLDGARGVPDLAGVLVLVDQGRDALASARSLAAGGPEIPPEPLCFFNPLHGDAAVRLTWRPPGSRRSLRVRSCRECARTAKDHGTPKYLLDERDGRPVPYFEAAPESSVWAATGYGQLRGDLIERILRGDRDREH
ncbi:hypothetical protein [Actinomadura sp. WMMB 499]|uniref:hypothetical protein n=1 Tax=Actinomadura sp. WMMB 499 TaxID=1219491 RepID=UPI00124427E7|nr:hypothetical protein [Actinomadura sp. WMMB 499]QFG20035.1 hypothetical protein F7P10_01480 [Actinomadura sp. WMMB 499]